MSPKTKTCVRCGVTKPATAEFYYWRTDMKGGARWYGACRVCRREVAREARKRDAAKFAATRRKQYRAKIATPEGKAKVRAQQRARYLRERERMKVDAAFREQRRLAQAANARARRARMDAEALEAERERTRQWRARTKRENPELWARMAQDSRIRAALRNGVDIDDDRPRSLKAVGRFKVKTPVEDGVDVGPFLKWMRRTYGDEDLSALAARFRVNVRQLRAHVNGDEPTASIGWLDGILTGALSRPDLLDELYPTDDSETESTAA